MARPSANDFPQEALDLYDPKIRAPLLIHNGALDQRIVEGAPAFEKALTEAKKPFQSFVYPGANHGFHNDTTPRYDEAAAQLSWKRTLDFFRTLLAPKPEREKPEAENSKKDG